MRIKAVEGIKAYNRDGGSLRQTGCVCLRAYPSISLSSGLSVHASVNGFRPPCGHGAPGVWFYPTVVPAENFSNAGKDERVRARSPQITVS